MDIKSIVKNVIRNPRIFFLRNTGLKQTIVKNTFWLAVAEGVTRVLKLILIIYVARILGATEYGKFTFALAFAGLFGIFSDLGVSQITAREISRENGKEKEFPAVLALKLLLSLLTLFLILVGSFFITSDPQIQKIIWIIAFFSAISGFSTIIFAFFHAKQKMEYQAWTKILEAVLTVAFGLFVIFYLPSVENLSYAYLFSTFLALIFISLIFHFKISPLKFSFNLSVWKSYLLLSWPVALAGMMGSICGSTDSTMMGYWGQITQTGWYNAAQRITAASFVPIGLITVSFFPALSKFFGQSKERLQNIWNYYMNIIILIAIPLMAGGIILAPKIINFVYDQSFFPSILTFQILIITGGIANLSIPFSHALLIANQQKKAFWIVAFGAVLNAGLNFILIPKYSLYGAAATSLLTTFLMFYLSFKFTSKLTTIKPFNLKLAQWFLIAMFSVVPMYFILSQPKVYNLNVILSVLIGAIVYFGTFLILKTVLKYSIISEFKKFRNK